MKVQGLALQKMADRTPWAEYELTDAKGYRKQPNRPVDKIFTNLDFGPRTLNANIWPSRPADDELDVTDDESPVLRPQHKPVQKKAVREDHVSIPMQPSHRAQPKRPPSRTPSIPRATRSPTTPFAAPFLPITGPPKNYSISGTGRAPRSTRAPTPVSWPITQHHVRNAIRDTLSSFIATNLTITEFPLHTRQKIARVANEIHLAELDDEGTINKTMDQSIKDTMDFYIGVAMTYLERGSWLYKNAMKTWKLNQPRTAKEAEGEEATASRVNASTTPDSATTTTKARAIKAQVSKAPASLPQSPSTVEQDIPNLPDEMELDDGFLGYDSFSGASIDSDNSVPAVPSAPTPKIKLYITTANGTISGKRKRDLDENDETSASKRQLTKSGAVMQRSSATASMTPTDEASGIDSVDMESAIATTTGSLSITTFTRGTESNLETLHVLIFEPEASDATLIGSWCAVGQKTNAQQDGVQMVNTLLGHHMRY